MASRLTDILQQEYKTKGLIGGAVSAFGKSSREKSDIRNILFSGSGIGSIVGRKVFGKGYSAIDRSSKASEMSSGISGSSSTLQEISINGKMTAKNSMALPMMARDMNVMRQNIVKLVKAQGVKPAQKADTFFMRAGEREKAYEAQFGKKSQGTTPTKIEEKKEGRGGLGVILGLVSSLFLGLASKLGSVGAIITGLVTTFTALGALMSGAVRLVIGLVSMLPGGKLLLKGLKLGALGVAALLGIDALSPSNKEPQKDGQKSSPSLGMNSTIVDTAAGVGGALAGASAIKAGSKMVTLGKQTAGAVSNARMAMNPMVNLAGGVHSPDSKWGKFLKFVERKAPKLFAKIGTRLAAAGALMAIPVAGWIMAAIQLGFSVILAYEIYNLWREFSSGYKEGTEADKDDTSPELIDPDLQNAMGKPGSPEAIRIQELAKNIPDSSLSPGSGMSGEFGGDPVVESASPTRTNTGAKPGSFNSLTREQQDAVLLAQREQEGFKPGKLAYDMKNPGAMLFAPWMEKFGGSRAPSNRGVGSVQGKFAMFPTLEQGTAAQRALWSGTGGAPGIYKDLPLDQALNQWVTGNKNSDLDTNMGPKGQRITNYKKAVMAAANLNPNTPASMPSSRDTGRKVSDGTAGLNVPPSPSSLPVVVNNTNVAGGSSGGSSTLVQKAMPYDMDFYNNLIGIQSA